MPGVPFLTAQLGANARIIVEAAWGADLSAAPGTWTWYDITADVRYAQKIRITPGRGDEASQAQPASCAFQLDNPAGTYSPYNPASTRYPYVRRNTPIRVSVDPGTGTPVTRFFGFANGFVPSWDTSAKLAVVTVSASGVLRRLIQGSSPLRSPLYRTVTARPEVRAYWPMEDGSDATSLASGVAAGQPLTFSGLTLANESTEPGSAPLPTFTTSGAVPSMTGQVAGSFSGQWQVDWYYRIPADPTPNEVKLLTIYTTDGLRWEFAVGGAFPTVSTLYVYNSAGTQIVASTGTVGTDFFGRWVHVFLSAQQRGSSISWFNRMTPVGSYSLTDSGTFAGTIGAPSIVTVVPNNALNGTSTGHIVVLDSWKLHVGYMAENGFYGEPATLRLARLCSEQGVALSISPTTETISEDFEGPLLNLPFVGTWEFSLAQAHTGLRSFKSASIGDSQRSDAILNLAGQATSMTFWYKVSSESGFDFFQIIRDGVVESQFSGEVGWTQRTVSLVGVNQVIFRYTKDSGTASGSDAAWIDDLTITGPSTVRMGTQSIDTFVNLLRECEAADGGVLYDGFSAGLGYLPNASRYNQAAALTLDVPAGRVSAPFAPADDDQRNRNKVTVSRKNGSSVTYEDVSGPLGTASIGTYDTSLTVATARDDLLLHRASWEVHKGTVQGLRYPSLNLDLAANPGLVSAWLNTTLQERIDVVNITSKATQHPPGDVSLLLEGYTENLSPFEWTVSCNCSPYSPYRVLKLDDPEFGRLDTAGSKLAAAASAGATSLSVAANPGPLWITTATFPAQFPLDINVGGWKVTVTGITGTSSPQTFTVNPIPAAIAINAAVKLWRPNAIAL